MDAGLVNMQEWGACQLSFDPLLKTFQPLIRFLVEVEDRAGTHRNVHLVGKVIAYPVVGDQLM